MEKRHGEDKSIGACILSEPELLYAEQCRKSRTRQGIPQPDGVNQFMEEADR